MRYSPRFWGKVKKGEKCWLWTAAVKCGYGVFKIDGKQHLAHRVSYELAKGPIPTGLHIDHLCRKKTCVNPDHLEAVTPKENNIRGESFSALNARKTHCIRGHELSGDNIYPYDNRRVCRICTREQGRRCAKDFADRKNTYKRAWRARKKAEKSNVEAG